MLVFPTALERAVARNARISGDQPVRVLGIALAMLLAGCEGDRIKQSETAPVRRDGAVLDDINATL
jgi:hypothetical protein